MGRWQHGLSAVGAFFIVIAAVAGYYVYKALTASEEPPSCKSALSDCMKDCRRSTTEEPAARACQEACQRDADACEGKR